MSTADTTATPDGAPAEAPQFTQAELNKHVQGRVASVKSKYEAELASLREKAAAADQVTALQEELDAMREQAELAGKSAAEQLEAKQARERQAYERKLKDAQEAITARDLKLQAQVDALQGERLNRSLTAALSAAKVLPASLDDAATLAALQLQDVTHHEDGSITASFGELIDAPITAAITEWVKTKPHLMPGPSGGAGTYTGGYGGAGSKPLYERSNAELMRIASQQRR